MLNITVYIIGHSKDFGFAKGCKGCRGEFGARRGGRLLMPSRSTAFWWEEDREPTTMVCGMTARATLV